MAGFLFEKCGLQMDSLITRVPQNRAPMRCEMDDIFDQTHAC